jgi:hypothetical protein
MSDPAAAARTALEHFFDCWNAADIEAVRAALNYPHITLGPAGQVVVAATAADFETDFEALRQREGWHHSTLDELTVVSAGPAKVHCDVVFSRYHADGSRYGRGRVLYIVTDQGGHWGMQFRSGLPDADLAAARSSS